MRLFGPSDSAVACWRTVTFESAFSLRTQTMSEHRQTHEVRPLSSECTEVDSYHTVESRTLSGLLYTLIDFLQAAFIFEGQLYHYVHAIQHKAERRGREALALRFKSE